MATYALALVLLGIVIGWASLLAFALCAAASDPLTREDDRWC